MSMNFSLGNTDPAALFRQVDSAATTVTTGPEPSAELFAELKKAFTVPQDGLLDGIAPAGDTGQGVETGTEGGAGLTDMVANLLDAVLGMFGGGAEATTPAPNIADQREAARGNFEPADLSNACGDAIDWPETLP
jgi:hypothetical protein